MSCLSDVHSRIKRILVRSPYVSCLGVVTPLVSWWSKIEKKLQGLEMKDSKEVKNQPNLPLFFLVFGLFHGGLCRLQLLKQDLTGPTP